MSSMRSFTPYLGMALVQLAYGGSSILGKLALEQGHSYIVFTVYRHLIAVAILGPLAYVLERSLALASLPACNIVRLLIKIFACSECWCIQWITCICRKQRQPLSLPILMKIFVLALFGTTINQNVYYAGLDYTTPTAASALTSVVPALTFALAVLLRLVHI